MNFSDKSRYNGLFHQVVHKEGDSAIDYIKVFQHFKDLAISVVNIYSEYQFMHTFLGPHEVVFDKKKSIELAYMSRIYS